MKEYDCGFIRDNKWFRYRVAATFFSEKLKNIPEGMGHIITHEY